MLRRIVLDFVRFLTTTPILRLPEHLRAGEARRRLVDQLEVLEDTLRDGADVEDRLLRLKALNIAHALRVALDQRVSDEKVDALDHAACRLIDDAGAVVPVPGRQGRLAKVNRESWEKHQLLDAMDLALDVAGVPADVQENGRLERRDIEAQWSALDRDAPADAASIIAAIAIHKMEAVLLRATTRPVSADADERNAEHRAVARAVRHLIRFRIASPQNVAFVALSYFGTPWKLRKNFFKGVEESWRQERDEMMAKYGHLLRTSRREG